MKHTTLNTKIRGCVVLAGPQGSGKKTIASTFYLNQFLPPNKWRYFSMNHLDDPSQLTMYETKVLLFCINDDPAINLQFLKQGSNENVSLPAIRDSMERSIEMLTLTYKSFDHLFLVDNSIMLTPPTIDASFHRGHLVFQKSDMPRSIEKVLRRISPETSNKCFSKKIRSSKFHTILREHMSEALQSNFLDALQLEPIKKKRVLIELGLYDSLFKRHHSIPISFLRLRQ